MCAALEGHIAIVEALIKAKADVRAANPDGGTAIIYASEKGHVDVVEALLRAGAEPPKPPKASVKTG